MSTRHPLVAANWKMHNPPAGWDASDSPFRPRAEADVIVFPSTPDLSACVQAGLTTGAQAGRPEQDGAFTGDVSMKMLADHGCRYVLCGHSERRQHHHESNEFIADEVLAAIDTGLIPILCIGETADQREMGEAEEIVRQQLSCVLQATSHTLEALVIAYEPVWAIGTGKTASADDAQKMHAFMRSLLPTTIQQTMRIIYGGSVKPTNAAELIAQTDVDGFLVGGASLKPEEFRQIVDAAVSKA